MRISKKYRAFKKGYLPNLNTEIFIISAVLDTIPSTYKIINANGEEIIGSFYEQEMVAYTPERTYEIETVLKEKGDKLFVKWNGCKTQKWIEREDLVYK